MGKKSYGKYRNNARELGGKFKTDFEIPENTNS
jgi:hypothetical protein